LRTAERGNGTRFQKTLECHGLSSQRELRR
jgi:hypothetical protein